MTSKKPVTLHRGTRFTGRVFRVERDRVRLPTGRTVDMDIVRHRGSVVLIAQPDPSRVILIRQFRYVLGRWIWELPAGTLETGEAVAHAARRECEEEIGLRPRHLERLAVLYPTPGFCDERMVFYRCTGLVRPARPAAPDPDEDIRPKTFTIREAWALAARGEIIDMKTVAGLVLAERADRELGRSSRKRRRPARPVSA